MRNLLITGFAIMLIALSTNGQQECKTRIKFSKDGKRPVAIIDLMEDYRDYTNRQFIGEISQINYDPDDGVTIIGFALELDNGIRKAVDITHDDCLSSLSRAEMSWLPYLIRRNYRVRVDAELSGSGGFINAKHIFLIGSRKKGRPK